MIFILETFQITWKFSSLIVQIVELYWVSNIVQNCAWLLSLSWGDFEVLQAVA